jgi:hypothetical protein
MTRRKSRRPVELKTLRAELVKGGAMLLVLVGPVSDFTEPVNEHRARQAVAGFALVEFLTCRAA